MTERLRDSIVFKDERFDVLARDPFTGLFHPQHFGITPARFCSSAPNAGFHCSYAVEQEMLLLAALEIRAEDGLYPLINEIQPTFDERVRQDSKPPTQNAIGRIAWPGRGHAFYRSVDMPIPYSGTLRIGRNPDFDYYPIIWPGWPDWIFRIVFDLRFENGMLRSSLDLTQEMADFRATQPQIDDGF